MALLGLDGARAKAQRLEAEAIGHLSELGEPAEPLRALASYVVQRSH